MDVNIQFIEQEIEVDKIHQLTVVAMRARVDGLDPLVVGSCRLTSLASTCPCVGELYVMRTLRGEGIGSKLLRFCHDFAKGRNKRALTLVVNKENVNAIRLYERLGFQVFTDDEKMFWMSLPIKREAIHGKA
jgi:ribosomal protein S18 acetylase RimI-like enzyme